MGGYRWSDEEKEVIKDLYGSATMPRIKTALFKASGRRRSYEAIRKKASKMGLECASNRCEFLTAKDLAECMGYNKCTVFQTWEKWGLKIKKAPLVAKKNISQIDVKDFWEFAYQNKHRIDFSKYQRGSIVPEPTWLKEELQKKQKRARKPLDSHKEAQIISLRKLGLKNIEIAEKLGLTDRQLQTALRAIYRGNRLERRLMRVEFSQKELELIKSMVIEGKMIKEIAEEVGRRPETVGKKIAALKKKGEWDKIGA